MTIPGKTLAVEHAPSLRIRRAGTHQSPSRGILFQQGTRDDRARTDAAGTE
jgi:hypothetical protein